MKKSAFTSQGNWYKGNLHTHTTASDGTITQEETVRIYKEHGGYDFLVLTEHNTYTDTTKYDTESFITLPGAEPMLWHNSRRDAFTEHIVCIGIPGKIKFKDGQVLEYNNNMGSAEFISWLKENGNYTIFAHPAWSRTRFENFCNYLADADAIEVYNHGVEGDAWSEAWFDCALWGGKKVWATASDDMHRYHNLMGGFVMCKAPALTREDIVNSLITGNFYASTGALMHDFWVEGDTAYVTCPPANRITFIRDMYPSYSVYDRSGKGKKFTEASCKLQSTDGKNQFIRCRIESDEGVAISQPIFFDDVK